MNADVVRIPLPSEGNPGYPLPPDYATLTKQGRRLARINACRQWLLPTTQSPMGLTPRQWKGFTLWESLNFFDHYYLRPDEATHFDPLFYDEPPKENPPFHQDIIEGMAYSRFTLNVCPRGSAKSGLAKKVTLLQLISDPVHRFVYATSSHDLSKNTGHALRQQCYENARVFEDFAPLYGGSMKPVRGDQPTGIEHFFLTNGSEVQLRSTGSTQRGIRPHRYILDDPEYDASGSTSMAQLSRDFETMLFRIIMPMVLREDAGIDWLATFVSKRHYAYRAMQGKMTPDGFRANDSRFNYWDRLQVNVMEPDPITGAPISCWPDRWPVESTDSTAAGGRVSIQQMRVFMGTEAFNAEMMGSPGDAGAAFFPELTEEHHNYDIIDADEELSTSPRDSKSSITWIRTDPTSPHGKRITMPLSSFLSASSLFITLDWAPTHGPDSDFKTACLMAHLPTHNELFVLDLWAGQTPKAAQVKAAFTMADKWKCPLLYPEVVKDSVVLYNDLVDTARTRAMDVHGIQFVPKVVPLKVGVEPKTEKIASLYIRFEHGLIKLPFSRRDQPAFAQLFDQIASFNPQAQDGGLAKDDCLDSVAMVKFVLKGRRNERTPLVASTDPVDAILEGRTHQESTALGMGVNWQLVDPSKIAQLLRPNLPTPSNGKTRI